MKNVKKTFSLKRYVLTIEIDLENQSDLGFDPSGHGFDYESHVIVLVNAIWIWIALQSEIVICGHGFEIDFVNRRHCEF